MFRLCLDNGLPAKPFKFVDHFDDLEETDDYKNDPNNKVLYSKKVILLNINDFKESSGDLKKIIFINNQLWIETDKIYFVCKNLSYKTIDYIKNNKEIDLAFLIEEQERISFLNTKSIEII